MSNLEPRPCTHQSALKTLPMMCKLLRYLTEGAGYDLEPPCWKNNTLRHQFDTVVFVHCPLKRVENWPSGS